MKIIDLLVKIANGEENTKVKTKYDSVNWNKNDFFYSFYMEFGKRSNDGNVDFLNDEIEIIEEDKKIEHCLERDRFLRDEDEIEHFRTKIDELIDEVNKLKGEK